VPVARLHRVPLAGTVLEPASPFGHIRAVLGMAGTVLGLDHPEALVRQETEGLAVVLHPVRVGRGSDTVPGIQLTGVGSSCLVTAVTASDPTAHR